MISQNNDNHKTNSTTQTKHAGIQPLLFFLFGIFLIGVGWFFYHEIQKLNQQYEQIRNTTTNIQQRTDRLQQQNWRLANRQVLDAATLSKDTWLTPWLCRHNIKLMSYEVDNNLVKITAEALNANHTIDFMTDLYKKFRLHLQAIDIQQKDQQNLWINMSYSISLGVDHNE